jgi:hypothetical protein
MKDTLDLWGDGDDVDVVCDVERAFGIRLTGDEAERTRTVGELYDLIEMKRPNDGRGTPACLSQIAFYRLCRALKAMGATGKITPQTPVSVLEVLEFPSISQKWRRLAQNSGLDLPPLETHFRMFEASQEILRLPPRLVWLLLWCCALTALGILLHRPVVILLGAAAAVAVPALCAAIDYVWWLVFRTVPHRLRTIGDLAREAAGCSFTKLTAEKRGCGPPDRWFALIAILRGISGHQVAITRETTFFAIHAKSAG